MLTLVLNCGSSSVKAAVLDPDTVDTGTVETGTGGTPALAMLAERLGTPAARLVLTSGGQRQETPLPGADYSAVFAALLQELEQRGLRAQVRAVGHRVVHGGEAFTAPVIITPQVMEGIQACVPLAPLHNPANLAGIRAAISALPDTVQVAVFDTAFHSTLPPEAYRYAVPEVWYREHGVRRYGFHGTSHQYVALQAARQLGRPLDDLNLITAHLGNGCSVTAIQGGRSVDTSMGLTPLEGVVMGTRSGDVDPNLHEYLSRQSGLSLEDITDALNKGSGLRGLSGLGSDVRELEQAERDGHAGAALALEVFVYRLAKAVAALSAALPGLDALVFTGGIGENSARVRGGVLGRLGLLGFAVDHTANAAAVGGHGGGIGASGARPALVIATDEERMIAQAAATLAQDGVAGGAA